jgi:hypothetical protein
MTCGGIIFLVTMFAAAAWLSDVVGSVWPLGLAGVLFILLIAWRFFEFFAQRDQMKRLDRAYESEMRRQQNDD